LEFHGGGTQRFGNILVGGEALQILSVKHGEHVESDVEGRFGIVDEIADDDVVLAKGAVASDEAENLIREAGHGGKGFDFLVGEARGLQNGTLNDFVGIADQGAAGVRAPFNGELHALRDGHF